MEQRGHGLFSVLGSRTIWLDEIGGASKLKLVLNSWVTGSTALVAEVLTVAKRLNVDGQLFLDIIKVCCVPPSKHRF